MNKKIYLLVILLTSLFMVFLFDTTSYAGTQRLKELQYDVILNSDGSMNVTENWNIRVEETNTLFKTFDLNSSKYGDIVDVKVSEIAKDGKVIPFENTGIYQYHVKKNGYYGLKTKVNEFEIAWGVSIENIETRTYQIKYKVEDAIKNYDDCSEFYWQFIGRTNGIPADKVKGTISLPKEISDKENLKVWAHGPLNGTINIIDNKTIYFELDKLQAEKIVEVRIVVLEDIFILNNNIVTTNKLNSILEEEQVWADEANRKRDVNNAILIGFALIGLLIIAFFIYKIIHYAKVLSKTKIIKPEMEIKYFRDFPDETATPVEAAFIYYFHKKGSFKTNVSKIVSATILNLALNKALSFEKDEKDNVYIRLNESFNDENLKKDEKSIYDLLVNVDKYMKEKTKDGDYKDKISMKDIEKYAKNNDRIFLSKIEGLEKIAKYSQIEKQNYDETIEKKAKSWSTKGTTYYLFAVTLLIAFLALIIFKPIILIVIMPLLIICGILCGKISKKLRMLTQKGENEKEKWIGLKRYMEDFSLLDEREVPELALWEQYLVFATAFGIADKVLSQLKVKYPEIIDENYMVSHGYTYMYMAGRINFDRMILSGIQKAYSTGISERASRTYSSRRRPEVGGFSGGGRRRSAVAGRNGWQIETYNIKAISIIKLGIAFFILLKPLKFE